MYTVQDGRRSMDIKNPFRLNYPKKN
jgi:hypothetical protein